MKFSIFFHPYNVINLVEWFRTFHVNVDELWEDEGHSARRGPGHLLKHDGDDGLVQQVRQAQLSVTVMGHDILWRNTSKHHLQHTKHTMYYKHLKNIRTFLNSECLLSWKCNAILDCLPYLAVSNTLVYFGTEEIPASHLSNVHPTGESTPLHLVPQGFHVILGVPLVADENLRWIFVGVLNQKK